MSHSSFNRRIILVVDLERLFSVDVIPSTGTTVYGTDKVRYARHSSTRLRHARPR